MAEIVWLGHQCFRIKGKDVTILTDPFDKSLGYELPRTMKADAITISNNTDPHLNNAAAVKVEPAPYIMERPGEYEVKGAFFVAISSYRDNQQGKKRGQNNIYVMTVDDLTICHLGDLGHELNEAQNEAIGDVDILLVPIGGNGGLDATAATTIISQIEPRIVIPMGYRTDDSHPNPEALKLDDIERFSKEMGLKDPPILEKLNIKKADLPENTQVVVLEAR
jgi:L-ascorbate metabolism protein UlaG (beta-lactamase superfamily)